MRKLLVWLCLLSLPAQAIEPELGVGLNHTTTVEDGFWYQQALPYNLKLNTFMWSAGLTGKFSDRWAWHVDYVSTGEVHSDALATTDENYDRFHHVCLSTPCQPIARYVGEGHANGVKLLVEYNSLSFPHAVMAFGPYFFRPVWTDVVTTISGYTPNGTVYVASNIPNNHIAAIVGVGLVWDHFQLRLDQYFMCIDNRCKSEWYPGIWRNMSMLSIMWSPK